MTDAGGRAERTEGFDRYLILKERPSRDLGGFVDCLGLGLGVGVLTPVPLGNDAAARALFGQHF